MLVQICDFLTALRLQLLQTADHLDVISIIALPDRDRIAPKAVAADRPVAGALKPLAEAAVLKVFRHPVDLLVRCKHERLDLVDIDEPAAHRPIDQRHLGSVTERIRVNDRFFEEEQIMLL